MPTPDPKTCAACGRSFEWRKKWAKNWGSVRYCSDACRRRKVAPIDAELERAILRLLDAGKADGSICPSEAALAVDPVGWRDQMEPTRRAARRLASRGEVELTQGGKAVDPTAIRGPVRIRRPRG